MLGLEKTVFARSSALRETIIKVDANHDDICQICGSNLLSNRVEEFSASTKAHFAAAALDRVPQNA